MKAAFSVWDNRIAPVFDVARHILLVEAKSGNILSEREETLAETKSVWKASFLAELGIDILICGAISRPLQEMLAAYGIRVIPFVAGDLREVIGAWISGRGDIRLFAMPGCCGKRTWGSKSREANKEDFAMGRRNRGGMGPAAGKGRGCQRVGTMGGAFIAGVGGNCGCPNCGHKEPHEMGIPCLQKQCPKCGVMMVRE